MKMTKQEIHDAIHTIFYDAAYTGKVHGMRFYTSARDTHNNFYYEFHNEVINLLLALYQKISNTNKEFLLNQLILKNKYTEYQDFIFVFLIKIKKTDIALDIISKDIVITSAKNDVFRALHEILEIEPNTFDKIHLEKILNIIDSYHKFAGELTAFYMNKKIKLSGGGEFHPAWNKIKLPYYKASKQFQIPTCQQLIKTLRDQVHRIKKNILSSSLLEGINLEINQDQEQLQYLISEFGFNPELNLITNKINERLYNAKDPFDFKSTIGLIRTFLNELCISIASEIERETGILPPTPIKKMGASMAYFRDKKVKFLSEHEDKLLSSLNSYMSNMGVHALKSERENARISKNMTIEMSLFLIKKLENYVS